MYSAILEGKAATWFRAARMRSWFAAVLILALCALALSACGSGGNGGGEAGCNATGEGSSAPVEFEYENKVEHWDVALPDRSRDSFDEVAYDAALQEFRAAMDGNDASVLLDAYDKLERLFADLSSDRALADFDRACAGFDEAAASAYVAKQAAYDSHYQECAQAFMDALESKHGEAFGAHVGEGFSSVLDNSSMMSSESAALRAKCDNLASQYSALVSRDASDAELKRLYVELVNANNAWARSLGYENYVEYVFATEYGRDYTMAEIEAAQDEVAREFVPVYQNYVANVMDDDIDGAFDALDESEETLMTNARACVARVSPALGESFDHLVDNGLYDISASEAKVRNSYTVEMAAYNDGCVFVNPNTEVADCAAIVHEFGHFNHMYRVRANSFMPNTVVDVQEIMSQGLELLCYDHYDVLCPGYGDALREYVLFDKLVAVREGFAINEAETRVYCEPDLTVDKVDAIWTEVYEKYSWSADENEWLSTSHLFTSPFYYAAYGTSALAALDLFAESRSDYAAAVGTYLRLSELAPETTYCQALREACLPNYLENGQVTAFSIRLANALGV
ncbi:MAG: hypothetical protein UDY71_02185 [Slackia isoflavoniconvertens]|nr:hypothetical protein [Slackia isoflavoniconvertens]